MRQKNLLILCLRGEMKTLIYITVLFCLLVSSVWAAPVLVAESLDYDFGQMTQGEKLEYVFRFQNNGDQVLTASQVRSSCGCTAALLSRSRLEPGDIGELKVVFDSTGFRGPVQKHISFNTNDPNHPSVTFEVRGVVAAEFFVEPAKVNWGFAQPGDQLTSELHIVNRSQQVIHLDEPSSTLAGVDLKLSNMTLKPGESAVLSATVVFPQDKNRVAGYIVIKSDFSNVLQLRVPVSARLKTP